MSPLWRGNGLLFDEKDQETQLMSQPDRPSLEQLAKQLRECAESLAMSLQKLKLADGRQQEYVAKLNQLSQRINETLAQIRRADPSAQPQDRQPSTFQFLDLTQYLRRARDAPSPPHRPEMTYVDELEFSDYNEFLRFQNLPAITDDDIGGCDVDALLLRLLGRRAP